MTDRFDEMSVHPDPSLAEALRQRLHARMAGAARDDHEGRSHLYPRAARLVPQQHLVPMKEISVPLNSTPNESTNRRRIAVAAAAVVAVIGTAGLALAIINRSSDDVEAPSPAPAASAAPTNVAPTTVAPTTVAPTTTASAVRTTPVVVAATTGTFVVSENHPGFDGDDASRDVRLTFAVPYGWKHDGWVVVKGNPIVGVLFDVVANIYTDSCPSVLVDPPVGPTVDDLASAWANLPGFDATAASDITVDGFHGKQIEFTVPDYNSEDCAYGDFKLLNAVGGGDYWAQGPNQHHKLWILDVNGTRLVIVAMSFPDTSPQDRAAIDEILASIQIG